MNNVNLVGRLTKDPELKYIPGNGNAVCTFTIAIDRDYKKQDGTKDTDFIPIQTWGKLAEICANNINKGKLVGVIGSIRIDKYTDKDGNKRDIFKVNADSVQFL